MYWEMEVDGRVSASRWMAHHTHQLLKRKRREREPREEEGQVARGM